jgi:hypothetical protein
VVNDEQLNRIVESYQHWLGKSLLDLGEGEILRDALDRAPFVLVAHGTEKDPIFNFANQKALEVFEMDIDAFCHLPSRYSAEQPSREERAALLKQVTENGYIDNYRGVRIASSGKRFMIEQAVVWNVVDEKGNYFGQAATFSQWHYL